MATLELPAEQAAAARGLANRAPATLLRVRCGGARLDLLLGPHQDPLEAAAWAAASLVDAGTWRVRVRLATLRTGLGPARTWGWRLSRLAGRVALLTSLALWVSTLGGAYSALGDARPGFAARAQQLALQQLALARALGDAALAARCRIFVAYAAMQLGDHRRASAILRAERRRLAPRDDRTYRVLAAAERQLQEAVTRPPPGQCPAPSASASSPSRAGPSRP